MTCNPREESTSFIDTNQVTYGSHGKTVTERCIQRLPLKQRLAFTLRKMHELDYDVIGQSLECSPESARAHVFQALRKIRTTLNGHALPSTEPMR